MPSSKKKRKNRKNKQAASKSAARKSVSKAAQTKRSAKKNPATKRPKKKTVSKSASRRKQRASVDRTREIRQEIQGKGRGSVRTASGPPTEDFEGLSRAPEADSESVAELVEEGNLFEAGAVAGVEEADNADEREVHTHEVPEDDVPEEYLDKD